MFVREDWKLFRSIGTLAQKAGVPARTLARLVAKELADNALDVSGKCRYGAVGENGFYIVDSGEGIPGSDEDIARLFSINRPLTSSKLLRLPTRGALGNGLRVVAGTVLATGGRLEVSTQGRTLRLTPQDDGTTLAENIGVYEAEGTRIEVHIGIEAGQIDLAWIELAVKMSVGGASYKGNTSPFWYDADAFFELTQAAGERSVRDLIASFDGCAGKRAGEIASAFKNRPARSLTRPETAELLCAARESAKPVNPERLGAVGIIDGLPDNYARFTGEIFHTTRGKASATLPYVIEVWADFHESHAVHVCVNRTPITGSVTSAHQDKKMALHGCGLSHFCGKSGPKLPRLWINIQTPYMPLTNDGKSPDLLPFLDGLMSAVQKSLDKAKRQNAMQADKKVTEKDLILSCLKKGCDRASGNGQYRFSQRQLYYAVRDISQKSDMSWENFCAVLTGYEKENGDIAGMYRDPRGILYHPHLHQDIPLGTLAVEQYECPKWTFNKVLYLEKEGFFAILKEIGWPERNDCALLTSKGYASRAARDVIDLLGDTGEELKFYCIHDADASGTLIYQSLQYATKARPAQRVEVVNLGLEPEQALLIGLEPEQITRDKPVPVAEYVEPKWKAWLQTQRVELNAMTTPQFLEWLDELFEAEPGKVVPPVDVVNAQFQADVQAHLQDTITHRLLEEGRLDELVAEATDTLQPSIIERLESLQEDVQEALGETPEHLWTRAVDRIAREVADEV